MNIETMNPGNGSRLVRLQYHTKRQSQRHQQFVGQR